MATFLKRPPPCTLLEGQYLKEKCLNLLGGPVLRPAICCLWGYPKHESMAGMSRSEQYTAIGVAIGVCFLFDHFHFFPSSYEAGRIAAQATVALSAGLVVIIWSFIVRKRKGDSDNHSE